MPCGSKPLIKNWDRPKPLRAIKPCRYEKNDASVKQNWKNVIRELELSYKDDKFWESQRKEVRELVGPVIFRRLVKIFKLPPDDIEYEDVAENASIEHSDKFYFEKSAYVSNVAARPDSMSEFAHLEDQEAEAEEQHEEEEEEDWSEDSQGHVESNLRRKSSQKTVNAKPSAAFSILASRNFSRMVSSKHFSHRAVSSGSKLKVRSEIIQSDSSLPETEDDMDVHLASIYGIKRPYDSKNPHFDMLYCNESETDMIKWNSHYKQKGFEISASDEYSRRAELVTKKIAKEFFDWWTDLGSNDYKSEIKRPEDIEDLFQVWFDEHASRSLVVDPKIIPCVLESIAKYVSVPAAACSSVLKRQIELDIKAETSPAHTSAFNCPLPQKLKHIPPRNNTKAMWHCVKIPEDLRSMAVVWDDVQHLTATKAFHKWLVDQPSLSMPPILKDLGATGDKKQLFVIPSDYIVKDGTVSSSTTKGLALPVSEYNIEVKDVLSKMMD